MSTSDYDRLIELLSDQATEGLDEPERTELKELLKKHPEWKEPDLELAAAAFSLTELDARDPLPSHVRSRVAADAERFFGNQDLSSVQSAEKTANLLSFPPSNRFWQWSGWYAAAASLVLAMYLGWQRPTPMAENRPAPSPAELRQQLLTQSRDLVQIAWASTDLPESKPVTGDLVWSTARQAGYMRFRGLAVNNPRESVYQLWIFDVNQDERYPIDGGVFTVTSQTGEVVIPITAKIMVAKPILFALTVEKPGGVVVSKRDRLILVAKPQATA